MIVKYNAKIVFLAFIDHCYTCSCIDSAIKWNMCKHIHLVYQFQYNISNKENNGTSTNCLSVNNNLNKMLNTEDEHYNETSNIILSQLNNSTITNQHSLE